MLCLDIIFPLLYIPKRQIKACLVGDAVPTVLEMQLSNVAKANDVIYNTNQKILYRRQISLIDLKIRDRKPDWRRFRSVGQSGCVCAGHSKQQFSERKKTPRYLQKITCPKY